MSVYRKFALLLLPISGATSVNRTVSNNVLQTWWHTTGEFNHQTAVLDGNVRQSHLYSVQVSSGSNATDQDSYYDSFVYETIPRNGNGNIRVPGDLTSTSTQDDGITVEADLGMTMAWTSFLYGANVSVKISRIDGANTSASNVIIRPTTLNYTVSEVDGSVYVTVPYSDKGSRFSVEFVDNLYSFHTSCACTEGDFVQDTDPNGYGYVPSFSTGNPIVGIEPHDALLIFASPFPASTMVPEANSSTSVVVEHGLVNGLDTTDKTTIIFGPGVYWFTGTAHAVLSSSVNWVHFDPGAYVKGAMYYNTTAPTMKATGHGVLSGEQYVYQANPASGYSNLKSDGDSLRMWSGVSSSGQQQTFVLNGVTVNAPPFNSMDFTGDLDTLSVQAFDYKQVGAFFGQTDGLENYPGSSVHDVFYHSNDDTIKTYYSNVDIQRITVWKGKTAPTLQFGWYSRSVENITVNAVDIIHSKYPSNGSHPSLVGANQIYQISEDVSNTANLANTVKDVTFSNFRSEGISGGLFRICPLANFENIIMDSFWIETFSPASTGAEVSELPEFTDGSGKVVSISGFTVKDFHVGGTKVSKDAGNWNLTSLGGINIAPVFSDVAIL